MKKKKRKKGFLCKGVITIIKIMQRLSNISSIRYNLYYTIFKTSFTKQNIEQTSYGLKEQRPSCARFMQFQQNDQNLNVKKGKECKRPVASSPKCQKMCPCQKFCLLTLENMCQQQISRFNEFARRHFVTCLVIEMARRAPMPGICISIWTSTNDVCFYNNFKKMLSR